MRATLILGTAGVITYGIGIVGGIITAPFGIPSVGLMAGLGVGALCATKLLKLK